MAGRQVCLYERLSLVDAGEKKTLIALGANLPNGNRPPVATVSQALDQLLALGLEVSRVSRFFFTPCFPAGAGPDYVNAAAVIRPPVEMAPEQLLAILHGVEQDHGRQRMQRWGMRTLDLDLISWGDAVLPDRQTYDLWRSLDPSQQASAAPDRLVLPHPRMQDRAFVLVPLADVAPDWRHPVLKLTVAEMLENLPQADRAAVRPL
ncbi:MAG: 2-amino-4-hydroxy-6-hydroxymethyldihydropteridine diphosphokinase [Cereibacter sphaeroides]|uniref:2-amino-4-hydroxy-6-hydroxymethyldihydropteridine pyrophosphokinase n=1 Tax=Cereibacter sphaeroides TaxID=1063 RepID=A0A2W5SFF7_CERSP|nr:MAG: 2-amino-4-hydroxy-6-hydroxymethyldihydropteridine diphosphokinase [Cereibacter sphaeroides]